MDSTLRKNILLGFFVVVGIILFIIGIFLVGSKNELFNKTFPITARFTNASGLKPGSNVRFNGVKVGIVKAVTLLNDSAVKVDMNIEESKRGFITRNAIASINSDGLMGDKLVNIITAANGGEPIQNNDIIASSNPIITDQELQKLSATNENIKVITDNLKVLTTSLNSDNGAIQALYKDPEMARSLKSSFNNLNMVTDKVLNVSSSLENITTQIQKGNGAVGKLLNDTMLGENLVYTLEKLKGTSDELSRVSAQLASTMEHINNGKGAVNLLLTDTAFASNIQQSMNNIKTASGKLDEDLEGLKHSFLLRRYFRKQEKKK